MAKLFIYVYISYLQNKIYCVYLFYLVDKMWCNKIIMYIYVRIVVKRYMWCNEIKVYEKCIILYSINKI